MRTVTVPFPADRTPHRLHLRHRDTDLRSGLSVGDQVVLVDLAGLRPALAGTVSAVGYLLEDTVYEIVCGVSDLQWSDRGPSLRSLPSTSQEQTLLETDDVLRLLLLMRDHRRAARAAALRTLVARSQASRQVSA